MKQKNAKHSWLYILIILLVIFSTLLFIWKADKYTNTQTPIQVNKKIVSNPPISPQEVLDMGLYLCPQGWREVIIKFQGLIEESKKDIVKIETEIELTKDKSILSDRKESLARRENYIKFTEPEVNSILSKFCRQVKKVSYRCANEAQITAYYDEKNDNVTVYLSNNSNYTLPHILSASGIKYANNDETLIFWSKGSEAFFMDNNVKTFDRCFEELL